MSIKIIGTGRGLPKRTVSNQELTEYVDTSDEWIVTRTGIKSRYICTEESLSDLCVMAAEAALAKAGLTAEDVDLLLCSTIGGDYVTPSLACTVQERIGGSSPAFDINVACSGFIYGLDLAAAHIETGRAKNVLLICAEQMSRHVDWSDRRTCILFGDGAGAAVITGGSGLKFMKLTSNGNVRVLNKPVESGNSPFRAQREPGYLYMDGGEVFKFAVSSCEKAVREAVAAVGCEPDDIDHFVLHQANGRIIESIRTRLKQPAHRFPTSIERYGNTSSASIPILLDEMLEEGRIRPGDRLFLSAFGGGLTTGACILDWE